MPAGLHLARLHLVCVYLHVGQHFHVADSPLTSGPCLSPGSSVCHPRAGASLLDQCSPGSDPWATAAHLTLLQTLFGLPNPDEPFLKLETAHSALGCPLILCLQNWSLLLACMSGGLPRCIHGAVLHHEMCLQDL